MTFEEFMSQVLKPSYVWRMAAAVAYPFGRDEEARTPMQRSGRTRMRNAQRRIDDLVLQRANTIADERRCAAVVESDNPVVVRCEYQRGHGPVPGRARLTPGGAFFHDRDYDHAAPSRGVWWMEPEEAHA